MKIILEEAKNRGERCLKKTMNFLNRKHNMSALAYAIVTSQHEVTSYLIQEKAIIYYDHNNMEKDMSPLFLCIFKQNLAMLEHMIFHNKID
jgi:hypothetical protein